MTRGLRWGVAATALGLAALAAAVLRPAPDVAPGPAPGRSLYGAHCATCHGPDGRGRTWRARLLLLRPGDLTAGPLPDGYVEDIVRHGGASFGKPGMPSFGFQLSDAEIAALVAYVRALPRAARGRGDRGTRELLGPAAGGARHAARPRGAPGPRAAGRGGGRPAPGGLRALLVLFVLFRPGGLVPQK